MFIKNSLVIQGQSNLQGSERIIQTNLKSICKGRTVFIIAHRLSTVRGADFIITMDKGRIIERGTHEQLLKRNGLYSFLNRQQELLGDDPSELRIV
jgi:subfamily B ATP-binding cassette protein HlyB/CyaB